MSRHQDKPAFDAFAERYDRWYETSQGAAVFRDEIACLKAVCPRYSGRWLEVGVGTGRFAAGLGITEGVDSSAEMLRFAARRGLGVHQGRAEQMPFPDAIFDGALLALSLCFVEDAEAALGECARILRRSGTLLVGMVPAASPWGMLYARKASEGHPMYSHATFRSVQETTELVEKRGFELRASASALRWLPEGFPGTEPCVRPAAGDDAGFVALRFLR